jgi:tetratricopeptide (TPR) repeat protein
VRYYAMSLQSEGKLEQAEEYIRRVITICEANPDELHTELASSTLQLAECYSAMGKADEALGLARKAHAIAEKYLGKGHPKTYPYLYNLALYLEKNQQYDDAALLFERILAFYQSLLEPDHEFLVTLLEHLEEINYSRGTHSTITFSQREATSTQRRLENVPGSCLNKDSPVSVSSDNIGE